ncbi:hypothetical protein IJI72_02425 [Candidatus Saccharibacteria bacterium]|nr:hypothetical protein [Candidatus Saccharibacteria bacterium]
MTIQLLPGFNPNHPLLSFNVSAGVLVHDELLASSLDTLRRRGWRFNDADFESEQATLLGYAPSNPTDHPDFGVSVHLEYDDFGDYTEVKLVFPGGIRDNLIRGSRANFTCVVNLQSCFLAEIRYTCTCEQYPHGCCTCSEGLEFQSVNSSFVPR